MTRVAVRASARIDLLDIADWYRERQITAGARVIDGIERVIASLETYPRRYALRQNLEPGSRLAPAPPYYVVYVYDEANDRVDVLNVVHGARDLPSLLNK